MENERSDDWPDYYADPVGHCLAALQYGNGDERFNAADILRGLGPDAESAVPAILKAMREDEDTQVRAQCAYALTNLCDIFKERVAFAVPALIETLQSEPDAETRSMAAHCLQFLGDTQNVVPALRRALEDEHEWVRRRAQESLDVLVS